jgi:glycolate dehydrogenase FAD-binding subunit
MKVLTPQSTQEAAELLRDAARDDLAVLVRGAGTKIGWAVPPQRADVVLDTTGLTGIVEHAAGDLITVVRAGTPMDELAAGLGDQQLALDPMLPGATVGGTVAANISGPRRMLYGTARDLLIGITVVRPDGTVAKAGGKVVKNVAGYDLGKLFIGSYGTLGLITELAFRLHPQPKARSYVRARADPARAVPAVLAAQVAPAGLEIDVPATGGGEMAVLVEGSAAGVRARAARLCDLLGGEASEDPPAWWAAYPWRDDQAGLKLTAPLSKVPDVLAAAGGVAVRGSAGTGVLYAAVDGDDPATAAGAIERLRAACVRAGGHAVVLTAPPAVRDIADMWGPVAGLALMRRVKDQFDPGHRFAPGRFVGGI